MSSNSQLRNILFDLGGVILDLNVNATLEAFLELGFPKELLNYPENFYTDIFHKYETGKTTTAIFREEVRKLAGTDFTDEAFDEAWCAMLYRVPSKRVKLLSKLSGRYDLYILSNTSPLHIDRFSRMFFDAGNIPLEDIFRKRYYSHEIGWHKPDPEAFRAVTDDSGIIPEETLFLDDNIQNVKAAAEQGFNVIHITENLPMEKVGFDI